MGEQGGGARPSDNPSLGVSRKLRPPTTSGDVNPFVHLPYITKGRSGGPPQPGFFGGYLGRAVDPLFIVRDPNAPDFSIPELSLSGDVSNARLTGREQLFAALGQPPLSDAATPAAQMTGFRSGRSIC